MQHAVPFTLTLLAAVVLPCVQVRAQPIGERSPLNVDGEDRFDVPAEQPGIRAGSFLLFPSAAESIAFDSNDLAVLGPRNEQAFSIAEAQLHLQNEPGAVSLESEAFARARRFAETHDQNTTEYGAVASIGAQLNEHNELAGRVLAQRSFESRTEVETPNFRSVSFYNEWRGDLSYAHTFNRLALRATVDGRALNYETASQTFRDRTVYRGELRGTYELQGGLSLIGSGYCGEDHYRYSSLFVASAQTKSALVGARWMIPDIAELELSGGYFRRTFAEGLGGISGFSARGSLLWQPTRLMTVRGELVREDAPTRIVGAFGKVRTITSLDIRHSYSRDIDLFVRSQLMVDDFDVLRRTDRTYLTEAGITRVLSRQLSIAAEYDYAARGSGAVAENFVRHVMSVSLIGRF